MSNSHRLRLPSLAFRSTAFRDARRAPAAFRFELSENNASLTCTYIPSSIVEALDEVISPRPKRGPRADNAPIGSPSCREALAEPKSDKVTRAVLLSIEGDHMVGMAITSQPA